MKRIIVGVIALYAVVLQAFAVSAAPVAVVDSSGAVICLQDSGGPGAPAKDLHRHHGVCCILACAAAGFAAIVSAGVPVVFAPLVVATLVFARTQDKSVRSPLRFYFGARGPPRSI